MEARTLEWGKTAIRRYAVEDTRSRWMAFYQRIRFITGPQAALTVSLHDLAICFSHLRGRFVGISLEIGPKTFSLRIDFSEPLVSLHCQWFPLCTTRTNNMISLKKRLHLLSCCFSCFSVIVTNSGGQYDLKLISQQFFFFLYFAVMVLYHSFAKIKGVLRD